MLQTSIKTIDPGLAAYAIRVGATRRDRQRIESAAYVGLKFGAAIFLVLLAIDFLAN